MKKFVPVLLALALATLCFSGCSNDGWTGGTVADGVYTNEALQMHFQIPNGWLEASEEETRSILGADPNDSDTIYDVLLGTTDGTEKMYLVCLDLRESIGDSELTAKESLLAMIDALDNATPPTGEVVDRTICGLTYASVDLVTTQGLCQRVMMHKLSDTRLVMLGIIAATETELDHYTAHFTDDPESIPTFPGDNSADVFSRGVITGKRYINEYLGLRFMAPADWIYATDAELSELMGISIEIIGEDVYGDKKEQAEILAKQAVIYDMVAAAPDGSNVQVVLENLSFVTGGENLSEAEYADILRTQLASITELSYEVSASYKDTLAGMTFTVVDANVQENDLVQRFWFRRIDNYILCLTFSGLQEDVDSFAHLFSAA